ncbi:nuclear transport factor 2 family protein [Roseateles oligotrophus]|uniref:Nuclear transport factor 2 family protein n=1 Tax=Roseateles oligotrophus TaxID=1769250 RepID=A0ABT2YIT4_9BURK|nr:nuclear transport factor 2 family protein [Roseateles oligotrophus]MCV2369943.1 nuclear transport factor 2 family protein [Roseateles oligotrophus]
MNRTPTELAQDQLQAYNAKDLDAFVACYSEDVKVWRMPADAPRLVGREAFRESYRSGPFAQPQVQAEIAQRIAMGNTVIDHEIVHGRADVPQQVAVVYRCRDGLIAEVYFFAPD